MAKGPELFGSIYNSGDVIFSQGQIGDKMYVIQSGAVEVVQKNGDVEAVLTILEKGDFFGEMALIQQDKRSATVTAIKQTRLISLTRQSLLERIRQDPGVSLHLIKGLIGRIKNAHRRFENLLDKDQNLRASVTERTIKAPERPPIQAPDRHLGDPFPKAKDHNTPIDLTGTWTSFHESLRFQPGQRIIHEGDSGDTMYFVVDGRVEISKGFREDRNVLSYLGPGDFFGEMAIISSASRSATVTAVSTVHLVCIKRNVFLETIGSNPELALHIIQTMIRRLLNIEIVLSTPDKVLEVEELNWLPLLRKKEPVRLSIVSLSTCAGCSSILLDAHLISDLMDMAQITYCPMLIDTEQMTEADVAIVDGVVRLKEDEQKLEETRRKSRYLVAWGTCAALGGIPLLANRFEIEELIEETYGQTKDMFAYYLSGRQGVDATKTYQRHGVTLHRRAFGIDAFVRADYYLPGCPPTPYMLVQLLNELSGQPIQKVPPVACAECGRKPPKSPVASLQGSLRQTDDGNCLHSNGIFCLGFLTRGGCGAPCTIQGHPCWGCRGPSNAVLKKLEAGKSFEEIVVQGISRRCKLDHAAVQAEFGNLNKKVHFLMNFDRDAIHKLSRSR